MAGDWIPIRENLCGVREVIAIASATGLSRFEVAGRLINFWDWAQRETVDGRLVDVDVDALVDTLATQKDFWLAVIRQGWLRIIPDPDGRESDPGWHGLQIPNFDHWLSDGAKARLQKNKRQSNWRGKSRGGKNVDARVDAHVDRAASTEASTTVPDRTGSNKHTHSRARDVEVGKDQGRGPEAESFNPFQPPTEEVERDSRFVNCGQRPLAAFPLVWLSPPEFARIHALATEAGLRDKDLIFERVQKKLEHSPEYERPRVNAFLWCTGWALKEVLDLKRSSMDAKRSAAYLKKAQGAQPRPPAAAAPQKAAPSSWESPDFKPATETPEQVRAMVDETFGGRE